MMTGQDTNEFSEAIARGARFAYFVMETQKTDAGSFIPCIAVEGVPGYCQTDWRWGVDFEIAKKAALQLNTDLHLSDDDVNHIIASSMKAQGKGTQ